jgi:hypothetical protein
VYWTEREPCACTEVLSGDELVGEQMMDEGDDDNEMA